jgi:hypothetical protein
MKRLLLVTTFGVLSCLVANADQSRLTVHEEPMVVPEPIEEEEPAPAAVEPADENTPDGFYAALGGGWSMHDNQVEGAHKEWAALLANATASYNKLSRSYVRGIVEAGYGRLVGGGLYIGACCGVTLGGGCKKNVGGDAKVNGVRVGGLNEDITLVPAGAPGVAAVKGRLDASTKNAVASPYLAVRVGYFAPRIGTLFYAKCGGLHNPVELESSATLSSGVVGGVTAPKSDSKKTKVSRIAPIVALGIDRYFAPKFSARLEVEYAFKAKKDVLERKDQLSVRAMVALHCRGI